MPSTMGTSWWELAMVTAVLSTIGGPLLVFVHELGHAAAVRLRRLPLEAIAVGDTDDVVVRARGVTLRFGRNLNHRAPSGFVRYDPGQAAPLDVLLVAVAGPLANLAVAPALAALAMADATGGAADVGLWLLAASSVIAGVAELIPREPHGQWNDGRIAQVAWAFFRGRVVEVEASPPPPPAAEPLPDGQSGMRWPFAAALVLVAAVCVAAGIPEALVPLVVLFGGALAGGAHRRNAW
jgi:hypothetical protein